jgi:prepilin-type N-terminal cleavage/methylation domain-containing protein
MLRDFLKWHSDTRKIVDDRQMSSGISEPPDHSARPNAGIVNTLSYKLSRQGFSLIEIVIAIGIVAFAVVPIIGSLVVAQTNARLAQRDFEICQVTRSTEALMRARSAFGSSNFSALVTVLSNSPGAEFFFNKGGRLLTNVSYPNPSGIDANAHYRVVARLNTSTVPATVPTNRATAQLVVSYPAPDYQESVTNPVSLFPYGTSW